MKTVGQTRNLLATDRNREIDLPPQSGLPTDTGKSAQLSLRSGQTFD
ncbi:hypothetical protein QWY75_03810 [Pontixanthobacter aestiaquae]|uniref:Uncharacterized protein n=1 Tax=Pontixanthobacter aestiaquae TaxID=1509367 RepID=A0A844Z8X3_9SPHN|nr:hypothetical protein [Pontixanthobacter aestiaquae]MDN3645333.1 hypothetical protein [Pontixanthobacter aestiaquae]MXO83666.1 hypothetical protein [Pontixanthobacter aestiaquae]